MKTEQFNHDNLFKITRANGKDDDYQALEQVEGFNDVYKHYCDYAKTVNTAYLKDVTDYVMDKLKITSGREDVKTACYYSSSKLQQEKKREKIKKLNDDGFFTIENDKKLDNKKIEYFIDNSDEMFGGIRKYIGKLKWSITDERLMAMKSRCRRRGIWVNNNLYVKFI